MVDNNLKLPTNEKFGFFFTTIFFLISIFFYHHNFLFISLISFVLSIIIFFIAVTLPNLLHKPNLIWNRVGIFVGFFVNPFILAIIYFGLFSPIGLLMRLFGRDELNLRKKHHSSFWKTRTDNNNDFTKQF